MYPRRRKPKKHKQSKARVEEEKPEDSSRRNYGCYYREDQRERIAEARRSGRKSEANDFRQEYYYCRCQDKKTCIWSEDRHAFSGRSSGITWVGVHGKNSICVVTKTGDLDVSRVHGFSIFSFEDEVFRNFRRAVISELEDIADPCSKLRKKLQKNIKTPIKTPFGVVSVAQLSDKAHKASCPGYKDTKLTELKVDAICRLQDNKSVSEYDDAESDFDKNDEDALLKYLVMLTVKSWRNAREIDIPGYDDQMDGLDELKTIRAIQEDMKMGAAIEIDASVEEPSDKCHDQEAIEFLEKKMMKSTEDFTLGETVKTAISAFQHLFNKNFKANEIEVSVMDPDYFILASEEDIKDMYVNHLERIEIDKYLSDINDREDKRSGCTAIFEG